MHGTKERYYRDPESRRQYWKRKYQENTEQEKEYKKRNLKKILRKPEPENHERK